MFNDLETKLKTGWKLTVREGRIVAVRDVSDFIAPEESNQHLIFLERCKNTMHFYEGSALAQHPTKGNMELRVEEEKMELLERMFGTKINPAVPDTGWESEEIFRNDIPVGSRYVLDVTPLLLQNKKRENDFVFTLMEVIKGILPQNKRGEVRLERSGAGDDARVELKIPKDMSLQFALMGFVDLPESKGNSRSPN